LKNHKIKGEFIFLEENKKQHEQVYDFSSKESIPPVRVRYFVHYDDDTKDAIAIGNQMLSTQYKLDVTTINLYWIFQNGKKYLCFIGQARSASGSGVQVSFFNLVELKKSKKVGKHYEFSSRFGSINSIIGSNKKEEFNYYKIDNGDKLGLFNLIIFNIKSGKRINKRKLILKNELHPFDYGFSIVKDVME
jgi:hypothetical protein